MSTVPIRPESGDPASPEAFSGAIGREYEMLKLICPAAADMSRQVAVHVGAWRRPDAAATGSVTILEIGCGTGITTAALLQARPDADLTAIDIAATMLAQAEANLAGSIESGRLRLIESDALSFLVDVPADSVDIVASGYAFHNFLDGYRTQVVREVYRVLRPGGVLINGDRYALDDPAEQTPVVQDELRQYFRVFSELQRPDLLEQWTLHLFNDESPGHVMRLGPALALYRAVGFEPVRIEDRYANNAVVSAAKPRA